MFKRIFCVVLSLITVISFNGFSCAYGGTFDKTVTNDVYKWTLCTTSHDFQEALIRSGISLGVTGKNEDYSSIYAKGKASDQSKSDEGYGKVMFVAEYTDSKGQKKYAYLGGSSNEMQFYPQNRRMMGQYMKNAYELDGFNAGAEEFFTTYDPGVPWVKAIYYSENKTDTGAWIGDQYAIRTGDGGSKPGKYFLTTSENIYEAAAKLETYIGREHYNTYYYNVGNGLSWRFKDINGSEGKVQEYPKADAKTDYFFICFNGENDNNKLATGVNKAYIKTFKDKTFERDPSNQKNVSYDRLLNASAETIAGYTRTWSVCDYNNNPVLFSSIYFDDNDQFLISDALIRLKKSILTKYPSGKVGYQIIGGFRKEDTEKMKKENLFYLPNGDNSIYDMNIRLRARDEYDRLKESLAYASQLGTDVYKNATMTAFYVYVGEKTEQTTSISNYTIKSGITQKVESNERISPGSKVTVEEGGTLIIDGNVFCYGNINIDGGTLIVKGQLLNTYTSKEHYPNGKGEYEKNNKASITARNGTIIVLEDAMINFEMCYSTISLEDNSAMYTYGMVCCMGGETIKDSSFVVGNEGVFVHGATLVQGQYYQNYTRGGLNKWQSADNASKTFYSSFLEITTPSSAKDATPSLKSSNSTYEIKGDMVLIGKMKLNTPLTEDLTKYYAF